MQAAGDRVSSLERDAKMGQKGQRRSHRKSRLGCTFCKRRKIKCDETKPTCSNCIRRGLVCSLSETLSATPSSVVSDPSAVCEMPNIRLDMQELQLFHHFCTSTALSFSNHDPQQKFWNITVPQLAFKHPCLLYAILSIAALDLVRSSQSPVEIDFYRSKAASLWESALQIATRLLSDINQDTRPALYLFATLACVHALILGPRTGDYLIFSFYGPPEWLVSFRGVQSIELASDNVMYNDEALDLIFCMAQTNLSQAAVENLNPSIREELEFFRNILIENCQVNSFTFHIYMGAFRLLEACYAAVYASSDGAARLSAYIVFAWLYRVSDEYLSLAQERQPLALALFAYFVVLIGEMKGAWMLEGWAAHLMAGIHGCMPEEMRVWIQWPMGCLGWTP